MDRNYLGRQGQQMLSSGMPKRPPMTPREIVPSQNNQMAPPPTNNEIMHEEIIKYIHSAWHKVSSEGPVFYKNSPEQGAVQGFTPFDLEGFWGRRLVQNIHINRSHP